MTRWCAGCGFVTGHRWDCPYRPADEETPRHHEGDGASGPGANPGGAEATVAVTSTPWSGPGAVGAADPAVLAVFEAWKNAPYREQLERAGLGFFSAVDMVRDAVAAVRAVDRVLGAEQDGGAASS